jgi:type VI protein secretion system component Hcp
MSRSRTRDQIEREIDWIEGCDRAEDETQWILWSGHDQADQRRVQTTETTGRDQSDTITILNLRAMTVNSTPLSVETVTRGKRAHKTAIVSVIRVVEATMVRVIRAIVETTVDPI